jgi:hypothetical protein
MVRGGKALPKEAGCHHIHRSFRRGCARWKRRWPPGIIETD